MSNFVGNSDDRFSPVDAQYFTFFKLRESTVRSELKFTK